MINQVSIRACSSAGFPWPITALGLGCMRTSFGYGPAVQIESWGPFAEGKHGIFQNELLHSIGSKYQKSVAQVILRWLIQRNVVAIPKSVRKERMEENFDVFDFELSPNDMESIATLDTKTSSFFDHRDPKMVKQLSGVRIPILVAAERFLKGTTS
jgi:diketogulonate reductase-like aldo/keto reductase